MLAKAVVTTGGGILYTCPSSGVVRVVGELNVCNRTTSAQAVRVAVLPNGASTPVDADWREYDRMLGASNAPGNGPLTRAIVLLPGQSIWTQSTNANALSAQFDGIPE